MYITMESTLFEILKIGGPTSVIVALFLWFLDRTEKRNTSLIENHLKHSTDAMEDMSVALTKLVSTIESLKRFIKRNSK